MPLSPQPIPSSDDGARLELAHARLCDARALLDAIEQGELLGEAPASALGRKRHETASALLDVLQRELDAIIDELG